jgi:hypothetical protein
VIEASDEACSARTANLDPPPPQGICIHLHHHDLHTRINDSHLLISKHKYEFLQKKTSIQS